MNLLGFNISIKRSASSSAPALQRSLSPDVTAWLAGENPPPRGAYLHNALEQVPWVYRSVMAIAEQVANIPFLFSRGERGRETLITSGPLHDLYARPNPQMNRFQYWEYRILWLLLRGECFRVPIYESSSLAAPKSDEPGSPLFSRRSRITGELTAFGISLRQPDSEMSGGTAHQIKNQKPKIKNGLKSILFLEPDSMTQIIDNHEIIGWRYNGAKSGPVESQVFLPEEVWYDRLPNPFDPWRGLPPLLPANNAAHTDFAASAFMRGLIENNADNGLIVRADHQLTDEQRAQITAALKNRKGSAGSPDRTILLWGATDIVKPSLSSADLQFLENRKFSRSEICAAFGVPEEIVATSDHNKYDVMQGARLNFIENRIAPLCARLEAEEQRIIQAIDPDAVGWFDIDSLPIMQEARRSRLAAAKLGFDMGIPFNELNKNFDLGFKELPWGNNGYLPSSLTKPQ
ncbi:MAG TPA: phage portal protein [Candidatus Dormibacteraeota bacterium]|nr:phage portal protein [Candidatus Dormibacteraeota bacterium]